MIGGCIYGRPDLLLNCLMLLNHHHHQQQQQQLSQRQHNDARDLQSELCRYKP